MRSLINQICWLFFPAKMIDRAMRMGVLLGTPIDDIFQEHMRVSGDVVLSDNTKRLVVAMYYLANYRHV